MNLAESYPLIFIGVLLFLVTIPVLALVVKFCSELAAIGAERAGELVHGGSAKH